MSFTMQVRNKAYFEELKAIGADEVIDTSSEDVVKRVKAITGARAPEQQW